MEYTISILSFLLAFTSIVWLFPKLLDLLIEKSQNRGFFHGPWKTHLGVGRKETSKIEKAAIAHIGLGGNSREETVYWNAFFDSEGNELSTEYNYEIIITEAIPVNFNNYGFWSITAYGVDKYLIKNDDNKYMIRSAQNSVLKLPYTIHLRSKADKVSGNTIPLGSKQQKFSLALRCYRPLSHLEDKKSWLKKVLPEIKRIK